MSENFPTFPFVCLNEPLLVGPLRHGWIFIQKQQLKQECVATSDDIGIESDNEEHPLAPPPLSIRLPLHAVQSAL
jgi:hypothetical protein